METEAEIRKRKETVCKKCEYHGMSGGIPCCEYVGYTGRRRPCLPSECVEKGVFKKWQKKKPTCVLPPPRTNGGQVLNKDQQYYRANREKVLARMATYYQEHKEEIRAKQREWRKNNRDKCKEYRQRYIAKQQIKKETSEEEQA